MTPPDDRVAAHVLYAGRVQGVGFRQTAATFARRFGVGGWVRNLADGRVELWAEGTRAAVEGLLAAVRGHFANHIRDEATDRPSPVGQSDEFEVRR